MHHALGIPALEVALLAGGIAAFAGAMTGAMILGGQIRLSSPDASQEPPLPLDTRLAMGAFLLASHAIAAASLWQVPTIGACLAAGLGTGWIGAAAAALVGLMTRPQPFKRRLAGAAFRAAVGLALVAPLWGYVTIMRMHAMGALGA
jgi:hypothetical protein